MTEGTGRKTASWEAQDHASTERKAAEHGLGHDFDRAVP